MDMGLEFVSGLYASNHNPFFDFMHRDAEDDFIIVSVRSYLEEAIELGIVRNDVDLDVKPCSVLLLRRRACCFTGAYSKAISTLNTK